MIKVTLKGGTIKEFENGVTPLEIAKSLGAGLAKAVLSAKVDGKVCDLRTPLTNDCEVAQMCIRDSLRCGQGHEPCQFPGGDPFHILLFQIGQKPIVSRQPPDDRIGDSLIFGHYNSTSILQFYSIEAKMCIRDRWKRSLII